METTTVVQHELGRFIAQLGEGPHGIIPTSTQYGQLIYSEIASHFPGRAFSHAGYLRKEIKPRNSVYIVIIQFDDEHTPSYFVRTTGLGGRYVETLPNRVIGEFLKALIARS